LAKDTRRRFDRRCPELVEGLSAHAEIGKQSHVAQHQDRRPYDWKRGEGAGTFP
jgi:hypothetical protein